METNVEHQKNAELEVEEDHNKKNENNEHTLHNQENHELKNNQVKDVSKVNDENKEAQDVQEVLKKLEEIITKDEKNNELNEGLFNVIMATYYSVTLVAILSLLTIIINLAFAIALTVTWSNNHVDFTFCPKNVFTWSQGLYIMLYISFGFELIYVILYCLSDPDNRPKAFSQIKGYLVGIPHFVFLIGSMVVYFRMDVPEICGTLHQTLLAYIITFWVSAGLNCLLGCGLICYFACLISKAEN